MKKQILKLVKKIGYQSALVGGGAASVLGIYQPVEPKEVQLLRSKNSKETE